MGYGQLITITGPSYCLVLIADFGRVANIPTVGLVFERFGWHGKGLPVLAMIVFVTAALVVDADRSLLAKRIQLHIRNNLW